MEVRISQWKSERRAIASSKVAQLDGGVISRAGISTTLAPWAWSKRVNALDCPAERVTSTVKSVRGGVVKATVMTHSAVGTQVDYTEELPLLVTPCLLPKNTKPKIPVGFWALLIPKRIAQSHQPTCKKGRR